MGEVELEVGLRYRRRGDIGVGVGVVAHHVPLVDLAGDETGVGLHVLADDEEGRRGVLGLEDVEDLRRPAGVGAVVEGQGHQAGVRSVTLDDVGGGHHLIALVLDQAGGRVDGQRALAGGGTGRHVQHFPGSVEVHVLGRRQIGQVGGRGLAIGMRQDRPDSRVLRA